MKNTFLPKILILYCNPKLLCSDEPIQILVILSQFQTFRSKTKLEGFVWSHWGIKVPIIIIIISLPNCNRMLIFGKYALFILLFPNILINPIISQIQIFVTSHFSTLLACSWLLLLKFKMFVFYCTAF